MKRILSAVLLISALLFLPAQVSNAQSDYPQSRGKLTPEELTRFFDRTVPTLMQELHVAGAVVGVADGSEILFLRGYGSADQENDSAVDPETTLFRAGSISKLFTWTAIMQLEEQGKLDLDDPVQKHLDFDLPENFEEPIRIHDLMNHTPGFEDRMIGLFTFEERYKLSLQQAVSRNIPRRIRPPATEVSYSNYGTMLAGYIVERISGLSYEEYVEKYIFQPLDMDRSTFLQPPPPELAEHLATGYSYRDGNFKPERFEIVNGAPAGAMSTTAVDMLHFYQAYLNGGQLNGRRILKEETVRRMQQSSFRHDPRANGFAHGFFESGFGELRVFGHGGDTMIFHSDSAYLPDEDIAYFVSTNTSTGMLFNIRLQQSLFHEFFPAPTGGELAAEANLAVDLEEYTGFFAMNRRSESDPMQLMGGFSLINPQISEDGKGLLIASFMDPKGSVYVPIDRDIFQQRDGSLRIVFLRDDQGKVCSLFFNEFQAFLSNRPPWIENPLLSLSVILLGLLLFLTALIAPPTGLLTLIPGLRWKAAEADGAAGIGRLLALWSGRGYLALIIAQLILVAGLGDFFFVPIGPVHAIPLYLAAATVVLVLISAVLVWKNKLFRVLARLHYSAFALFQVLFIAWLGYWGFFFV